MKIDSYMYITCVQRVLQREKRQESLTYVRTETLGGSKPKYIQPIKERHHTVNINYVYTGHPFSLIITFPFLSKPMITMKPTTFLSNQKARTALSHVTPPHRLSVSSFGLMEFVLEIFLLTLLVEQGCDCVCVHRFKIIQNHSGLTLF
ncbi:Hypothetical_protein [Hexamita inflata]|uniref:Hypothetical_protein n=1 Tax=Hexamita inflata TaxID=28002 RepID=A0AA86RHI0_9EUKA|nr:Hypothetical protein HINF_LOCUS61193 [Hexamita inflata]